MATQRYYREIRPMQPGDLNITVPATGIRILGMVEAGSLKVDPSSRTAQFQLSMQKESMPAWYQGDDLDSLRELKMIVLTGDWTPAHGRFEANKISLLPNYGYIAAAYLTGSLSLVIYLMKMEWQVARLYQTIKEEKLYQPEELG